MRNIDEMTIRKAITTFGIERLLAALPQRELLPALGMVSMSGLAQMMDMNYSTLRWHMGRGRIPRPTIRLRRRAYYTKAEADAITAIWKTEKFSWKKSPESGQ